MIVGTVLACAGLFAGPALAEDPAPKRDSYPRYGGYVSEQELQKECQHWQEWREKMLQRSDEMNAELQKLIERMNEAEGQAEVEAMEKVVEQMITERQQFREEWLKKRPKMVRHMLTHNRAARENPELERCPVADMESNAEGGHHMGHMGEKGHMEKKKHDY
jgi:DNA repair exonuclease SbcCD ATPase subunit